MDIFKEIEQATSDWKLAHGIKEQINAAARPGGSQSVECEHGVTLSPGISGAIGDQIPTVEESAAPLTFADIPLGESFVCLEYGDEIVWEKCGETYAICYDMGHVDDKSTFKPTDRVRIK